LRIFSCAGSSFLPAITELFFFIFGDYAGEDSSSL
jgi:hypothetical protein